MPDGCWSVSPLRAYLPLYVAAAVGIGRCVMRETGVWTVRTTPDRLPSPFPPLWTLSRQQGRRLGILKRGYLHAPCSISPLLHLPLDAVPLSVAVVYLPSCR
ncbi:hypothetical protein LZ32DRAFT_399014 [Colletotrichum eremochloae]|nr:hypothetical protein LZ32DRAFT_399014 [Colletotrichum eremochloae]